MVLLKLSILPLSPKVAPVKEVPVEKMVKPNATRLYDGRKS